jgi:hypothetical protein
VDIINTSLGYFEFDTTYNHTYSDMDGITALYPEELKSLLVEGIVVACRQRRKYTLTHIGAPADAVSVLAIGAVNSIGNRASFSSTGPSYDQRVKPDLMAQGVSTVLSNEFGDNNGKWNVFSGPVLAGMVVSFAGIPTKTNKEIRDLIIQSSDKYCTYCSIWLRYS